MKEVIVVIGAGQIGQAIARRVGAGRHILLAIYVDNDATIQALAERVDQNETRP